MTTYIKEIAYALPENILDNAQLERECPGWNVAEAAKRVGVHARHIAAPNETALDLAVKASESLFNLHPSLRERIDGLIFCTQSPDHILPPNACVLHRALRLKESVMAFDISLACSGFTYALGMAQGLLHSGAAKEILLVTGDTYSKYISAADRSTRMLFGDGVAVTWLSSQPGLIELQAICFSTDGSGYDKFIIPAGGCRTPKSEQTAILKTDKSGNQRTLEQIHMDGLAILNFVKNKVAVQIRNLCTQNQLSLDDIDLFVFHQASQLALDALMQQLRLPKERVFINLERLGNTVSATIPIALKQAIESGKLKAGHRVLLSGFGVGLSWSSALARLN